MTTIVIHHSSNLAAYVIAIAIYLQYRHVRSLRIVVVENSVHLPNQDLKPWCGISTVNNLRVAHHDLLVNTLIGHVLVPDRETTVTQLTSVSIARTQSGYKDMDRPMQGQNEQIRVTTAPNGQDITRDINTSPVALVYHPIALTNRLRTIMANTSSIVFVSLHKNFTIDYLVAQLASSEPDKVVLLDFMRNQRTTTLSNFNYLMNSNLISLVNLTNNRPLPISILWLPKFRSVANTPVHNELHYNLLETHQNIINIDINPAKFDLIESEVILHLDLTQCIKTADFSLHVVEDLIHYGKISVLSYKL